MQQPVARSRPRIFQVIFALLLLCLASSGAATPGWAAGSDKEICDVDADLALGLEDYPAAIALHRKILRVDNSNAVAHYHLGFAYGMVGRTDDEIGEYLTAVRLRFNQWDLFLNLGLAYLGRNDSARAIEALQTAASFGPEHAETHFNLAIAYERSHRLGEARTEIAAALRLAPNDPEQHNIKAVICAEAGDLVCARAELAYLVRVAPDYAPARINLAILSGSPLPSIPSTSAALDDNRSKVLNTNRVAYAR
jgi:Flp pilus assembly protein TadD